MLDRLRQFRFLRAYLLNGLVLPLVNVVLRVARVNSVACVARFVARVLRVTRRGIRDSNEADIPRVNVTVGHETAGVRTRAAQNCKFGLLLLAKGHIMCGRFLFRSCVFCLLLFDLFQIISALPGRTRRAFRNLFDQSVALRAFFLLMRARLATYHPRVAMINVNRLAQPISGASRSTCLRSFRVNHDDLSANGNILRVVRYATATKAEGVLNLNDPRPNYLRGARYHDVGIHIVRISIVVRVRSIARAVGGRDARINNALCLGVLLFNLQVNVILRCRRQVVRSLAHRFIGRHAIFPRAILVITL